MSGHWINQVEAMRLAKPFVRLDQRRRRQSHGSQHANKSRIGVLARCAPGIGRGNSVLTSTLGRPRSSSLSDQRDATSALELPVTTAPLVIVPTKGDDQRLRVTSAR